MKQTAVDWFQEQIIEIVNGRCEYSEIEMYKIAKEMEKEQMGYSKEDMKSFADWCRNGLLNIEYGVEKLDDHLKTWEQFKNK